MKEIEANKNTIVQQTITGENLPGMEDLCKRVKGEITTTVKKTVEARIMSLMVARVIFEYAAREDVIARVQMLNVDPVTGKKAEGRPKQAHRLAMNVLAIKCKVTFRTIENWVNDWLNVSSALELKPNCTEEEFKHLVGLQENVHDWLDNLHSKQSEQKAAPEPTPEQIAKSIKDIFQKHFYTDKGTKKLAPAARSEVMQSLNPVLKDIGFEIHPLE